MKNGAIIAAMVRSGRCSAAQASVRRTEIGTNPDGPDGRGGG